MNKGRYLISFAILATFGLVLLMGCSSAPAAAPTSAPAAAPAAPAVQPAATTAPAPAAAAPAAPKGTPIKIAYIGTFTGMMADLGTASLNGAKLSVEDVNKSGGINGRPLELISYDDGGDPSAAVTRTQRALTSDGAEAVIGGSNASTAMAIKGVSTQSKVVDISPQAQNRELTDGAPYLFRVGTIDLYNARALIALMIKQGYSKPAMITDNTAFGQSGQTSLKEVLTAKNIKWVTDEKINQGASDVTAQVLAGKNAGADVLLTWIQGADGALVAKTKKQLGFDVPMMGLDSLMHASALPIAGDSYEGVIAVSIGDTTRPDVQDYFARYQQTYGIPPATVYSPCQGYDAVQILATGLKKVNPTDKIDQDKVKAAIESIDSYSGITGPKGTIWKFSATNHSGLPEGASVFYKVQSGKWVRFAALADVQ
jgi:branched-chain amino acid transport system substrate-binding protein